MTLGRRNVLLGFTACLAIASTGCTASSKYMLQAPKGPIERSAEMATVVFVRPSSYASAMRTTILDARGRFLGDSLGSSYFAVKVPPGEHVFIAWAENTAALRATLAPQRVYFVEVSSKMGAFSARMHLLAIAPRKKSWQKVDKWLAESDAYTVDEAAGQAYLRGRAEDTSERIERAKETLTKYDASELDDRTLTANDGR